jgi:hypothetical protein
MNNKIKKLNKEWNLFSLFLIALFICLLSQPLVAKKQNKQERQENEPERIVETVYVKNVIIPVRVFDGKNPVGGLTKNDFDLYINNREKEISNFFEIRKKIERNPSPDISQESMKGVEPRLFVLLFILCDYHQDLSSALDILFRDIILPKDRLIAITNRYFLPEWTVGDPARTKESILKLLKREISDVTMDMNYFESELKLMAATFKSRMDNAKDNTRDSAAKDSPDAIFREFFMNYRFIIDDMRNQYLKFPAEQYIKIAEYLNGQKCEKWVFNFFQIGHFPTLDPLGRIYKDAQYYMSEGGNRSVRMEVNKLYMDFFNHLHEIDDLLVEDINRVFLNSGATFYTLLLKPINPYFSKDFRYEPINTETETTLKKIARMTGGCIVKSNKMEDFVKKVTVNEDILYSLIYIPDTDESRKKRTKLEIKVKNKKYRAVYDDKKRLNRFRDLRKSMRQENPNVEIEEVFFKDNRLTVKLKNIKVVKYEKETFGAVQAKIKILDENLNVMADFERSFKGINEEGIFQTTLPSLPAGSYNLVLEIKDLFSLTNTFAGEGITINL